MKRLAMAGAMASLILALGGCGGGDKNAADQPTVTGEAAQSASLAEPAMAESGPPPVFLQCKACHAIEAGANGIGPSLHGVVGRKAGSASGYAYSPALQQSGLTWDRASLDKWLKSPLQMVPGTRMMITVPDAARRKEIIDYLETLK